MTPQTLIRELAAAKGIEELLKKNFPQYRLEVIPSDLNPLLPGGYVISHVSGGIQWSGSKPPTLTEVYAVVAT